MRNLVVISEVHGVVEGDDDSKLQVAAAAVDVDNGLFFVASQSFALICFSLASSKVEWIVALDEEAGPVVAMDWRVEVESVVVGRASGQVVEISDSGQEMQEVGSLKGGLLAMAASPDGELLLLATGLGQLLVMTQDWDLLYEVSLDKALAAAGSVQLSWRGDGKYFATLVTGSESDGSKLKIWERDTGALHASGEDVPYLQTAMAWCPSGARIATSCVQLNGSSQPLIMSFEKNGLKRDKFQLEGPADMHVSYLKWNSNSELLAMVVTTNDWIGVQIWSCSNFHWYLKQELRFPSTDELNVLWDPEDAMKLVCWTASGTIRTLRLGWKSAVLDSSIALVINGHSLLVSPLSLTLVPPPMSLFSITFQAPVQVVAFLQDSNCGCFIAARLSDSTLSMVTLPKLCDWLDLEGENHAARSISVLSDLKQSISELRHLTWLSSGALLGALSVQPGSDKVGISGNFSGTQNGVFWQTYPGSREILVEVDLDMVGGTPSGMISDGCQIQGVQETPVKQAVISIIKNHGPESGDAFVQLGDGSAVLYTESQVASEFGRTVLGKFARPCPWMSMLRSSAGDVILLGLDEKGGLEALGHCVLCRDCTSFVIHTAADSRSHLLYTTQRDSMHVVSLSDPSTLSDLHSKQEVNMRPESMGGRKPKGAATQEENLKVRPLWERGARLITALGGHDVAVIVQTMRGNLETVYPRGLVLGAIAEALKQGQFREAMGLTRRHHINLNVIVDYGGWRSFCVKASEFVKQVGKLNHITELVYALNEENIVDTTYKNLLPPFPEPPTPADAATELLKSQLTAKVQTVLKALRLGVEKEIPDGPTKELCILATLAKSRPPELKEALQRIKSLREAELQGEVAVELEVAEQAGEGAKQQQKVILSAEAALKHLLWLSDAEIVFKEALGLYDLHLAAMVASHAQRDPKEFLPLLKELEEMPSHIMQYKIDVRLGHYESALQNLAQGGEENFIECLQLMMNHAELFPLGLHIFRESSKRVDILEAWGDHLVQQEKFEDAAAAYCSCNQLQKALDSYRCGGLWRGAMTIAGQLNLTRSEFVSLASELGEELQAMGRPAEAACVALEYTHDVDSGVRLLLEAREWMEAVRVASLYSRDDLVRSLIEAAALECASALIEEFTEGLEKVRKYYLRYQTVRQRRLALAAKLKAEEDGEWPDDDTVSEASSHLSGMSAYSHGTAAPNSVTTGSGRSRKSRSQKKAKGGRIRAGSAGEEWGLIEYIRGMAVNARMLEEVRRLLSVLLLQGHYITAHRVQSSLAAYQSDQKASLERMEEDAEAADKANTTGSAVPSSSVAWRLAVLDPPQGECK